MGLFIETDFFVMMSLMIRCTEEDLTYLVMDAGSSSSLEKSLSSEK